MRRHVLSIIMASGLVMVGAGTASAEPVPTTGAAEPVPGKKVCKIEDPRLTALSGMVATKEGFVVINDGVPQESGKKVFFLDAECKVVDATSFSGNGPRDTEDMVLSPDGKTIWIADTGDNSRDRETVGLWSMPADGSEQPKIHRLSYPGGEKRDAEALLLNGDGTPIIISKEVNKPAAIYVATGPLKTNNTEGVSLRRAGEVTVPPSTTPAAGVVGLGRGSIDGAAVAPDGSRVVLRTYTDALEFDVTGGDVLAALKGKPRVTPLPNEPFGEAITYSADGTTFLTVSDMDNLEAGTANWILRYTPATNAAKTAKAPAAAKPSDGQSWSDSLSLDDITYLVGGVGLVGAILVGLGVFGIVRARRRPPSPPADKNVPPKGPTPVDAEAPTALIDAVRDDARPAGDLQGAGQRGRGSGYGGGRPPVPPPGSGVYGAKPPGPAPGGGVYGGQPAGRPGPGGVYGAPPPAGPSPVRPGPPPGGPGGPPPTRPGPPAVRPAPPVRSGPPVRPGPPSTRPTGFFPDGGRQSVNGQGVNGPGPHGGAANGQRGANGLGAVGHGANGHAINGPAGVKGHDVNGHAGMNGQPPGRDGHLDNPGYGWAPRGY